MEIPSEARAFLSAHRFAVLATINASGAPQQTVMWYELRGDTIVMNTTDSRLKSRNLTRDARISVCVADGYRYVTIAGEARLVDDHDTAQADIHRLATLNHGEEKAAAQMAEQFSRQQRVSIYLPIERVYIYGL